MAALLAAALTALLMHRADAAENPADAAPANFVVIDAMKGVKSEDLTRYGLRRLHLIYTSRIWPNTRSDAERQDLPKQETISEIVQNVPKGGLPLLSFDIEHWKLDIRKLARKDGDDILAGDADEVKRSVSKMVTILQWAKAANPSLKYGYYSCVPIRDYFTPVKGQEDKLQEWKAANDVLAPLADASDALFPSLYTFYKDQQAWTRYAIGVIAEAKRLAKGKPVYVYVWPCYHSSNAELKGQYIEGDFWRLQLETIHAQGVAGIVIWDGSKSTWDPARDWWKETLAFMRKVGPYRDPSAAEVSALPLPDSSR